MENILVNLDRKYAYRSLQDQYPRLDFSIVSEYSEKYSIGFRFQDGMPSGIPSSQQHTKTPMY